jgi:hypothetical protein
MAQARKEQQEVGRYRKRMMVDKIELIFIALTHILKGKSVRFGMSKFIELEYRRNPAACTQPRKIKNPPFKLRLTIK